MQIGELGSGLAVFFRLQNNFFVFKAPWGHMPAQYFPVWCFLQRKLYKNCLEVYQIQTAERQHVQTEKYMDVDRSQICILFLPMKTEQNFWAIVPGLYVVAFVVLA